jgi:hypothetical protein
VRKESRLKIPNVASSQEIIFSRMYLLIYDQENIKERTYIKRTVHIFVGQHHILFNLAKAVETLRAGVLRHVLEKQWQTHASQKLYAWEDFICPHCQMHFEMVLLISRVCGISRVVSVSSSISFHLLQSFCFAENR